MAKRLEGKPEEHLEPASFPEETRAILGALDEVRLGHLEPACSIADFQTVKVPGDVKEFGELASRDDTLFEEDCKRLLELADYLESIELKVEQK